MARLALVSALLGGVLPTLAPLLAQLGTGRTGSTARLVRASGEIVQIAAGEFRMGSTAHEITRALELCLREPLAHVPHVVQGCMGVPAEIALRFCQRERFFAEEGEHRVWLGPFAIDRTEVTVGAYARCVRAGACRAGLVAEGSAHFGASAQPMVGVTWDDALGYCRSSGGRLPTEAEWERAARGRDARLPALERVRVPRAPDARIFPWGTQFDPRRANHGAIVDGCYSLRDGYAFTAPVGSYPDGASPDGVLDMAGNAAEWVADFWSEEGSRYPVDPAVRLVNPTGAASGAMHIVRGGAYDQPAFAMRTTHRGAAGVGARSLSIGFRCAYDVAP